MALTSIPYTQTGDRLLNQIQSYILNPLNIIITSFNSQPVSSSSSGSFGLSSTTFTQIPNLNVNFTATGRPIRLDLLPDGNLNTNANIEITSGSSTGEAIIQIVRDTSVISSVEISATNTATSFPPNSFSFVDDNAPTGNHQYYIQAKVNSSTILVVNNIILRASQE